MKLIKKGNKKVTFMGECKKCGSIFESDKDELNVIHDRDGQIAKEKCTECYAEFWLYPKTTSLQPCE